VRPGGDPPEGGPSGGGRVLAVVLAGGLSRRMGRPKALVPLGGRPLIAWPLAAAAAAGLEAVVVAKPGSVLPPLEVPVWDEPEAPSHPLTGLVAALERAGGPVVALACDMPFVSAGLVARLAAARGVAAPAGEAFPARYEPSALPVLRAGLERETAVRAVLAELGVAPAEADAEELVGINDPEALARAEAALS
jgi:molybdopterin-guanine dinucleotide biosynthesis protein A